MQRRSLLALGLGLTTLAACDIVRPTLPEPGDASLATLRSPVSDPTPSSISLVKIGGFDHGAVGASEITSYDAVSKRLFVVNGANGTVDVLDFRDPSNPILIQSISVAGYGFAANSIATRNGIVEPSRLGLARLTPIVQLRAQ